MYSIFQIYAKTDGCVADPLEMHFEGIPNMCLKISSR